MADTIKAVPNKISISGHTDATPYSGSGEFGNWELSANRANAARRALVAGSYPEAQVARVVGYASSALFDREHPFNPVNRRIDIVVLTKKAQRAIEGSQGAEPTPDAPQDSAAPSAAPAAPVDPNALPADKEPLPAHELRERLNLFDDPAPKPGETAMSAFLWAFPALKPTDDSGFEIRVESVGVTPVDAACRFAAIHGFQ
jgi:chemotaxis protein MotB